jgi:UDP-N-acetylmuramate--alanine ligase
MGKSRLHFIGVGGVGMSGIAKMCLEMGEQVSGSDMQPSILTQQLADKGAQIHIGHDAALVGEDVAAVVISTAIHQTNPEIQEAIRKGVPVIHRGRYLAKLMDHKKGIAVAGAHGKTTTTAMIAMLLEKGGLDPAFLVGAYVDCLETNAKWGKGEYMVAEADESDGSFLFLNPHITLVTNIEDDHLDYYGSQEKIDEAFISFVNHTPPEGVAILCMDDPKLVQLLPNMTSQRRLTYGTVDGVWLQGKNLRCEDRRMLAEIYCENELLGTLSLKVPGNHNLLNALGAIAVGLECGMDFSEMAKILFDFGGAYRRFQWVGIAKGVDIYDDYAHHPTEIKATLAAARLLQAKRVVVAFQPHRYSRTQLLADEFGPAFMDADQIVVLPIYAAGEQPIEGVSATLITQEIIKQTGKEPQLVAGMEEAAQLLSQTLQAGDMLLTLGAGNVGRLGALVLEALKADSTESID